MNDVTMIQGPRQSGKTTILMAKARELASAGQMPLVVSPTYAMMRALKRVPMRPLPQTTQGRGVEQEKLDDANVGILFTYWASMESLKGTVDEHDVQAIFLDEAKIRGLNQSKSLKEHAEYLAEELNLPVYAAALDEDAPKPSALR